MSKKSRKTRTMSGSILFAAGTGSAVGIWANNRGLWVAIGVLFAAAATAVTGVAWKRSRTQ